MMRIVPSERKTLFMWYVRIDRSDIPLLLKT
jgi:hypothetical protein